MIRPALAAFALVGSGLLVAPAGPAASAPPRCPATGMQASADASDAVLLGTVTDSAVRTVGTGARKRRVRSFEVELERIYRGTLESSPVTVTAAAGPRGLPAIANDERWLFFLRGSGQELEAVECSGSVPATPASVRRLEGILGAGEAYVEPPPPPTPLAYESMDPDAPLELGRLVAPGAAVTLIGLLGLVLTRRRRG